jgi:hypothetical protein
MAGGGMQIFSAGVVIALKLGVTGVGILAIAAVLSWRAAVEPLPAKNAALEQPIPFSHKHHAGDDGIAGRQNPKVNAWRRARNSAPAAAMNSEAADYSLRHPISPSCQACLARNTECCIKPGSSRQRTTKHKLLILWRPQGDSNPCRRRERAVS